MLKHGEFTMHSIDENDDLLFSVTIKGPEAEEDFWHNELKIKVAMALIEGTKFDSFESEIVFNPTDSKEATGFFKLFEPWYMKIIISKKERVAEQKLQMIPKIYIIY